MAQVDSPALVRLSEGLGAGAEARKEWREAGTCTNCDTPVTLVHNSDHPTCRMDRRRYVDARFPDRGWCLFRCKACHAVIDKNWAASEAPNVADKRHGTVLRDGSA